MNKNSEHVMEVSSLNSKLDELSNKEDQINECSLEIFQDKYTVIECKTEDIEMYQVKMFYYQSIPGLLPFRFSMSQNKSYLYYKNDQCFSLSDIFTYGFDKNDILRILEQLKVIYDLCRSYLLYEENIQIRPNRIKIKKEDNELNIQCMYIPLKRSNQTPEHHKSYNEDYKQLISILAKMCNSLDYMEGYYYFTRLYQDLIEEKEETHLYKHFTCFLSAMLSEPGKKRLMTSIP